MGDWEELPLHKRERISGGTAAAGMKDLESAADIGPHVLCSHCGRDLDRVQQAAAYEADIAAVRGHVAALELEQAQKDELIRELRRQLADKDTSIASLRVQAELVGVRKGLEKQLQGAQDFGSRCQSLMDTLSRLVSKAHGGGVAVHEASTVDVSEHRSSVTAVATPMRGLQKAPVDVRVRAC